MNVRNRFDKVEHKGVETGEETKVQQQFKEASDINHVVSRFKKTGQLFSTPTTSTNTRQPVFGVYPSKDYLEMYNHIQEVRQQFMALPPKTRQFFDNKPENVVRFMENPANLEQAVKLKLCNMPEGYEFKDGVLVEQQTLVKADDEANPNFQKPQNGGGT